MINSLFRVIELSEGGVGIEYEFLFLRFFLSRLLVMVVYYSYLGSF